MAEQPCTIDFVEMVRPWYRDAFEKACLGESLRWMLTWAIVPTSEGQMVTLMCCVWCGAPDRLGSDMPPQVFGVPVDRASEPNVHAAVAAQVALLLAARSKALNGLPGPSSRLVVP